MGGGREHIFAELERALHGGPVEIFHMIRCCNSESNLLDKTVEGEHVTCH